MLSRVALLVAVVQAVLVPSIALADARPFTFTSDAYPMGKGDWEYEQWVTYEANGDEQAFEFRHEFEFGITDNFDLALYLPEWSLADDGSGDGWESDFAGGAIEGVVYLFN